MVILLGVFEGRINQHKPPPLARRQQRTQSLIAVAGVHAHLPIMGKARAQQGGIFRMKFATSQPIPLAHAGSDQKWRTRIKPQALDEPEIVGQSWRRTRKQQADATPPLPRPLRRPLLQRIGAGAGVRIQDKERALFASESAQEPHEQRVLHAICKIAGMKGVPIIHLKVPAGIRRWWTMPQAASAGAGKNPSRRRAPAEAARFPPTPPSPRCRCTAKAAERRNQTRALWPVRPLQPESSGSQPRLRPSPSCKRPANLRGRPPWHGRRGRPKPRPPPAGRKPQHRPQTIGEAAPAACLPQAAPPRSSARKS